MEEQREHLPFYGFCKALQTEKVKSLQVDNISKTLTFDLYV